MLNRKMQKAVARAVVRPPPAVGGVCAHAADYVHRWRYERTFRASEWSAIWTGVSRVLSALKERDWKVPAAIAGPDWPVGDLSGIKHGSQEGSVLLSQRDATPPGQVFALGLREGGEYGQCNTMLHPYDFVVCCALTLAKHEAFDAITMVSTPDHLLRQWKEAAAFIRSAGIAQAADVPIELHSIAHARKLCRVSAGNDCDPAVRESIVQNSLAWLF